MGIYEHRLDCGCLTETTTYHMPDEPMPSPAILRLCGRVDCPRTIEALRRRSPSLSEERLDYIRKG